MTPEENLDYFKRKIYPLIEAMETHTVKQVRMNMLFWRMMSLDLPIPDEQWKQLMKAHTAVHRMEKRAWYFKAMAFRGWREGARKFKNLEFR